jgi:hypothetical protein
VLAYPFDIGLQGFCKAIGGTLKLILIFKKKRNLTEEAPTAPSHR